MFGLDWAVSFSGPTPHPPPNPSPRAQRNTDVEFPLRGLTKPEVRELAAKAGLPLPPSSPHPPPYTLNNHPPTPLLPAYGIIRTQRLCFSCET